MAMTRKSYFSLLNFTTKPVHLFLSQFDQYRKIVFIFQQFFSQFLACTLILLLSASLWEFFGTHRFESMFSWGGIVDATLLSSMALVVVWGIMTLPYVVLNMMAQFIVIDRRISVLIPSVYTLFFLVFLLRWLDISHLFSSRDNWFIMTVWVALSLHLYYKSVAKPG